MRQQGPGGGRGCPCLFCSPVTLSFFSLSFFLAHGLVRGWVERTMLSTIFIPRGSACSLWMPCNEASAGEGRLAGQVPDDE